MFHAKDLLLNKIQSRKRVEKGDIFDRQISNLSKEHEKRKHKSIRSVYTDAKRPYKAKRDTKNSILSLHRAHPENEVHHGQRVITYIHSNPSQKVILRMV